MPGIRRKGGCKGGKEPWKGMVDEQDAHADSGKKGGQGVPLIRGHSLGDAYCVRD